MTMTRFSATLALLAAAATSSACMAERSLGPQRLASSASASAFVAAPAQVPFLFVVDGVRYPRDQVPTLTGDQISAITVLKGHAALKEYGPDASYGVVVITARQAAPHS